MPGRHITKTWHYNPQLHAPARYRRACRYDAFVPTRLSDLSINIEATLAGLISEAEQAIQQLNESGHPALAPLARLLLRTESIASSKIEGLQIGIRELAKAETQIDIGQHVGPTAIQILANIDAMELAMRTAVDAPAFTVDDVVSIHKRLMERAPNAERIAGRTRDSQNWIGGNDYNPCGADFVPPPPEVVPDLLDDLCLAINDERLPTLVQAAIVHAQFETIHPFADGNGRTGRALIHVVLKRRRVAPSYVPPISVILAADRGRYIDGLTRFRGDGVNAWLERFATAAFRAARLARTYLDRVSALQQRWRESLSSSARPPRSDAAAWAIIGELPAYPVITGSVATAATGRGRSQVYEGIDHLVDAGVLAPLSASKRNRSWEAVGLLDLLALMEGEP